MRESQGWYLEAVDRAIGILNRGPAPADLVATMAREEMSAYRVAMQDDPLLPRSLYPEDYLGWDVYERHCRFRNSVARMLEAGR